MAVGEHEFQPALDHVSHVRALAAIVREPSEQRRELRVRGVRLETDRIRPEVLEAPSYPSSSTDSDALDFDAFGIGFSFRNERFRRSRPRPSVSWRMSPATFVRHQ